MITEEFNKQLIVSENPSWTIPNICEKENYKVIRKFINSAIYVEKEVVDMAPSRKTSPLSLHDNMESNNSDVDDNIEDNDTNHPPPHTNHTNDNIYKAMDEEVNFSNFDVDDNLHTCGKASSNCSSERTETTVKALNDRHSSYDLNLSLSTLNTNRTNRITSLETKEKEEIIQNWIAKKEWEKKRKQNKEAKLIKQREAERLELIERERENFKRWLVMKKDEEDRKKAEKELMREREKLRKAEKEKRRVENEITYNLWLRRKKKSELETKIKEKITLLQIYQEKQKRIEENEKAYQTWLEKAKYKQKPIPMNKGIESLCSSVSVAYINPLPWTPNISLNEVN